MRRSPPDVRALLKGKALAIGGEGSQNFYYFGRRFDLKFKLMNRKILPLLLTVGCGLALSAQTPILDSGGPLMPQQAAYDVSFYSLSLTVNPEEKFIEGTLVVEAEVVHPMHYLVLDLDTLLTVRKVTEQKETGRAAVERSFRRDTGKLWIDLERTRQRGERLRVALDYGGRPRVAPRAPWDGGFTWAETPAGAPWIATTCQTNGADLWWPCKDHVSDEPDSMALHIRVPEPLDRKSVV